jgi:prepilin-type N-terminal cleavage/methylation domain-containing protein/prepilin-type processing-associated H-X9-DG protein
MDFRKDKFGFTLIELLVVISIIALLVSILLPALQSAKRKASGAVCLVNQKGIALAWIIYSNDNADRLVGGEADYRDAAYASGEYKINWVYRPEDEQGNSAWTQVVGWVVDKSLYKECELWGIRRGKLFPYIEAEGAYHCPADSRDIKKGNGFRSYSIVATLNGYDWTCPKILKKMSQIKHPAEKYVSVEEPDMQHGGWNIASWWMYHPKIDPVLPLYPERYSDPVGTWHGGGTVMNFADGHAVSHQWEDDETVKNAEIMQRSGTDDMATGTGLGNDHGYYLGENDYLWMLQYYL